MDFTYKIENQQAIHWELTKSSNEITMIISGNVVTTSSRIGNGLTIMRAQEIKSKHLM